MQSDFWLERWRLNQIGFHRPEVFTSLQRFWPHLGLATDSPVFVPLCGKSLDMLWLAQRGHPVRGVELSSVALESFCLENGIPARRRSAPDFDSYEAERLHLWRGDFFALTSAYLDGVGAIYGRAALVALPPEMREPYVRHLTALTPHGALTLLVTLEYAQAQMNGPPFAVSEAEVRSLFGDTHDIVLLGRDDVLDSEPRFRAKGVTALHEVCYKLARS